MNFSGKEGHPNIQPSTRPGIEPGTSGLGGRDLNHCANPSVLPFQSQGRAKTCSKPPIFGLLAKGGAVLLSIQLLALEFVTLTSNVFVIYLFMVKILLNRKMNKILSWVFALSFTVPRLSNCPQSISFVFGFISGKCSLFRQFVILGPVLLNVKGHGNSLPTVKYIYINHIVEIRAEMANRIDKYLTRTSPRRSNQAGKRRHHELVVALKSCSNVPGKNPTIENLEKCIQEAEGWEWDQPISRI